MVFPCPQCHGIVSSERDSNLQGGLSCPHCGIVFGSEGVLGRVAVQHVRAEDLPEGPVVQGSRVPNAGPESVPRIKLKAASVHRPREIELDDDPTSLGEMELEGPPSLVSQPSRRSEPASTARLTGLDSGDIELVGADHLPRVAAPPKNVTPVARGAIVLGAGLTEVELKPPAPAPTAPPPHLRKPGRPPFGCTLLLESQAAHSALVHDGLLQIGLCGQVICASEGAEFLTTVTQALIASAEIDLAILDLEAPELGGYHAALALRAIEKAYNRPPIPILFFGSRALDEAARHRLNRLEATTFLLKETARGADQLHPRLVEALRTLKNT